MPISAILGNFGARVAFWVSRKKGPVVIENLKRVLDTQDEFLLRSSAQEVFKNYARYWVDTFRVPKLSDEYVNKLMTSEGLELIFQSKERGKGTILALPHVGGWEFGGRWLATKGIALTVVAERLEPPELFDWFCALRSKVGLTVVPLGPSAGTDIIKALRANKVVALLCDRVIGEGGVPVEMFSSPTLLPAGPATLAIRTGATILPTAVYSYPDGHHHARILEPIECDRRGTMRDDVSRITQDLAGKLEGLILDEPTQWHMLQPLFV